METRRAYFRNMRSKCRCSYVLQFTWHLGVSSVLHRPLSQIIHCIVLYLDFQTGRSECLQQKANNKTVKTAQQGEITTQSEGQLFKPTTHKCIVSTQSLSHSQQADRQTYQPATEELCYQHIRQDALLEQENSVSQCPGG
jgi:hypothetical protein